MFISLIEREQNNQLIDIWYSNIYSPLFVEAALEDVFPEYVMQAFAYSQKIVCMLDILRSFQVHPHQILLLELEDVFPLYVMLISVLNEISLHTSDTWYHGRVHVFLLCALVVPFDPQP